MLIKIENKVENKGTYSESEKQFLGYIMTKESLVNLTLTKHIEIKKDEEKRRKTHVTILCKCLAEQTLKG